MRTKFGVVLIAFCLATAVAMAVSRSNGDGADISTEVVAPAAKHAAAQAVESDQPQPDNHFDINAIKRGNPSKVHVSTLMQPKSWYMPPPPPKQPQVVVNNLPPPPPSPPPMPFTYIGRMIDGNDVVLFLVKNGTQYSARLNDVLDGSYHIDKIGDNEAVLTYIPLNAQQTLLLNSTAGVSISLGSAVPNTTQPPLSASSAHQPSPQQANLPQPPTAIPNAALMQSTK